MTEIAVGIDVGGTKVALGAVASGGRIIERRRLVNADAADDAALLAAVTGAVRELTKEVGPPAGIGIGLCELVGTDGEVASATSISWTRGEIIDALSEVGPVAIDADVRAAALAEATFGAGRAFETFVYVTVGTGISHCLVIDGQPYPGARGFAQLIGSARLSLPTQDGLMRVALEDVAAGPALARRAGEASAEAVMRRADDGDEHALLAVADTATILGSFIALLVDILDPAGVVIGGGLGSAGGSYWERIVAAAREAIWADPARSLPIMPAQLGPDAGVVGAALLVIGSATAGTRT